MPTPATEAERDARTGRFKPGTSGNPAGRPPAGRPYARLLEAAEECGAQVVVLVPPTRRPTPPTDTPPRAA
jgi:predicted TIM-barrel fold metal-dependent hydrolase